MGLALRLVLRRFGLYAAATAGAIGLQALVAVVARVPHGTDLGSFIVPPILTTLVYAFVSADARREPVPARVVWERFLERAWAVIVIDFVLTYVAAIGLSGTASADPLDAIVGILAIGLSVVLVFADAAATVDDDVTVWSLIPRAFGRSLVGACRGPVFLRALAILALQLLVFALENQLYALLTHLHVSDAAFWSQVPLLTVAVLPLSALTVLVYLDATADRAAASD